MTPSKIYVLSTTQKGILLQFLHHSLHENEPRSLSHSYLVKDCSAKTVFRFWEDFGVNYEVNQHRDTRENIEKQIGVLLEKGMLYRETIKITDDKIRARYSLTTFGIDTLLANKVCEATENVRELRKQLIDIESKKPEEIDNDPNTLSTAEKAVLWKLILEGTKTPEKPYGVAKSELVLGASLNKTHLNSYKTNEYRSKPDRIKIAIDRLIAKKMIYAEQIHQNAMRYHLAPLGIDKAIETGIYQPTNKIVKLRSAIADLEPTAENQEKWRNQELEEQRLKQAEDMMRLRAAVVNAGNNLGELEAKAEKLHDYKSKHVSLRNVHDVLISTPGIKNHRAKIILEHLEEGANNGKGRQ